MRKMMFNTVKTKLSILISLTLTIALFLNHEYSYASIDWNRMNTWEAKSNTKNYGMGARSVSVGNNIYLFGGYTRNVSTSRFEIYDSLTDTWLEKPDMPYDTKYHGAEEIDGKIYVFGGERTDVAITDEVYCYDIKTDTWSTKAPMPKPKRSFASGVIDGKIYVAGGWDGGYSNTVECYDPKTDTWTQVANMPTKRSSLSGTVSSGKLYTFGGWNNSSNRYLTAVECYNPNTNTWETKANMPIARTSMVVEEYQGNIYVIGGDNADRTAGNMVECYDTIADKWVTLLSMPTARYNPAVGVINGKIYVIDGGYTNVNHRVTEMYNAPNRAYISSMIASRDKTTKDIERARFELNKLEESPVKRYIQSLIDNIEPLDLKPSELKSQSLVSDIYITPQNNLNIGLDTNIVSFEEFTGVEDLEQKRAISISVQSSLPYSLEVSMPTDIKNTEGTTIINKNLVSIKESSQSLYSTFENSTNYLMLLDNQPAGKSNQHYIDIKLNGGVITKVDVYKTTLKFKIEQK